MKYYITLILIVLTLVAKGQRPKFLKQIYAGDTVKTDQAIIYGNFVQRLGFSSGGFEQTIQIINIDTREIFAFRVKHDFSSAKQNSFVNYIKPGNYAILYYCWAKSTWYGGKHFTEPIFKDIDATDNFEQKINSGELKIEDLRRFVFTITGNSINYLGTWHFKQGLVSFTDDKIQFDKAIRAEYHTLNFTSSKTNLPH